MSATELYLIYLEIGLQYLVSQESVRKNQWNEYNWNATSIVIVMAKSWSQILRDTSPRHACLGEVSRESASRQSRELIMRSERTTNVQRGGRRESQALSFTISGGSARRQLWSQKHGGEMPKLVPIGPRYR